MEKQRLTDKEVKNYIYELYLKHKAIYISKTGENAIAYNDAGFARMLLKVSKNNPSVLDTIKRVAPSIDVGDILVYSRQGDIFCGAVIITRKAIFWKKTFSLSPSAIKLSEIQRFSWEDDMNQGGSWSMHIWLKNGSFWNAAKSIGDYLPEQAVDFLNEMLEFLQNNQ